MPRLNCHRNRGFSLIELLLVMIILGVILAVTIPPFVSLILHSKIEGCVRSCAILMQQARFDEIKRGGLQTVGGTTWATRAVIKVDSTSRQMLSFIDVNNDLGFTPGTDIELQRLTLPSGVDFWGPPDATPNGPNAIQGLTADPGGGSLPKIAVFHSDGSIEDIGAFRFGDKRGNFLEILVSPQATARFQVRKWDGAAFRTQGENGISWTWN